MSDSVALISILHNEGGADLDFKVGKKMVVVKLVFTPPVSEFAIMDHKFSRLGKV